MFTLPILLRLLLLISILVSSYTLLQSRLVNRVLKYSRLLLTPPEIYECSSLEQLFGREGVIYFNDEDADEDSSMPFLFSKIKSSMIAEIPLIPFDDVIFPNSRDFLHVTDMRFRFVFQKVEEGDDMFGRCFLSQGKIGKIGCICKIIERRQAENGEQMYIIEAVDRFRILKITQSSPYLKAEVEIFPKDTFVAEDVPLCEQLCAETYFLLQVYIRLTRLQSNRSPNSEIVLTSNIFENKPKLRLHSKNKVIADDNECATNLADSGDAASRHEKFSNACANLLSTERVILQQLLQSQSTKYRLSGVKSILVQAVGEISALLADEGLLSPSMLRDIEAEALSTDSEDVVSTEGIPGPLTLAAILGETSSELVNYKAEAQIVESFGSGKPEEADSGLKEFDSVWDNLDDAFQ